MCKKIKTNETRLERIQEIASNQIGSVRSVSLKLKGVLWTCTLKMQPGEHFEQIAVSDEDSSEAVKGLKNRLKKIIKRYNQV